MTTTLLIVVLMALMALRVPISIAMGIACLVALIQGDYPLDIVPRMMTDSVDSFALLAVPFFVLAGNLMNAGGVTDRIFGFARALFGAMRGGLAQVNVVSSMIFAGMSGAALADLAGLGSVMVKAMRENGYTPDFAAAVTLSACVIAPIIPPSIVMVIYALVTDVSIGRLFLAGVIPGVIIGLCLMAFIYYLARFGGQQFGQHEPFAIRNVVVQTRRGFLSLLSPVVILGFLVAGYTTVSEIGVVAVIYALLLGVIHRELTLRGMAEALKETAYTSGIIMYLVAISSVMGWIITTERVFHDAAAAIAAYITSPLLGLLAINVFLLLVGTALETLPALLICSSILFPIVKALGIDPVHFGVIICYNLILGIITPPVGIGLFVAARVANISVERVVTAVNPFYWPLLISLTLINLFPGLCLWLPNLVFGPAK